MITFLLLCGFPALPPQASLLKLSAQCCLSCPSSWDILNYILCSRGGIPSLRRPRGCPQRLTITGSKCCGFRRCLLLMAFFLSLVIRSTFFLLWWKHKQLKRPKRKITWDGEGGMAEVTCKPFPLLSPLDTGWRAPPHPCSWAAGMFLVCDYLASEHGMMSLDNVETINNKSEPSLNWLLKNTGGSPDLKTKSCWLNMLVYFLYFA